MSESFFAREADDASLDRAAHGNPENPFLVAGYLRAQRALGQRGWLLAVESDGALRGAALCFLKSGRIRRSLSIPSSPTVAAESLFWPGLDAFCREHDITDLEISTFATPESVIPRMRGEVERVQRTEYALALRDVELWAGVSKGHRHRINRGRKNGLTVRRDSSAAAIDAHVALHITSMDRRKSRGEDVSLEFERSTSAALVAAGAGELFQAMLGDHVASSLLVLRSRTGAYSESSGTSREGMDVGASHFLWFESATLLQAEGTEMFYLGGARAHEEGLRTYKSGLGATPIDTEAVSAYMGGQLRYRLSSLVESVRAMKATLPQ